MKVIAVMDQVRVNPGNFITSLFLTGDRRKFAGQSGVVIDATSGEFSKEVFYTVYFDEGNQGIFIFDELDIALVQI